MRVDLLHGFYLWLYLICHCLNSKWDEFQDGSTILRNMLLIQVCRLCSAEILTAGSTTIEIRVHT
jgi:hypothetical protein